ncbi:MAG: zinc-binding dehydrogenase [Anaerolineae bacterium]
MKRDKIATSQDTDSQVAGRKLSEIARNFQAGRVTPVIDRRYMLSKVSEALRYTEKGTPKEKLSLLCEGMNLCFQR